VAIRVVARLRPRLPRELREPEGIEVLGDGVSLLLTDGSEASQRSTGLFSHRRARSDCGDSADAAPVANKVYTLDDVIDSRDPSDLRGTQAAVYERLGRELLNESLKGFNICLFAYGYTGSGKTYTMLGDSISASDGVTNEHVGLIPRFLHDIFVAKASSDAAYKNTYVVEFYEVYNDQIRDLVAPVHTERSRKVHVHPKYGVTIDGLTENVVNSAEEALELLVFGNQTRTMACTTMNERSSRSHAFFTFKSENDGEEANHRSRMTFCDLAGREEQDSH
jgi:hypothetical protein